MTIKRGSAQTIANKSIIAAENVVTNMYTGVSAAVPAPTYPTVTSLYVTDSLYNILNPQPRAVDSLTGGYIKVLGTGFTATSQVSIQGVSATSVTYVSSTELNAQVPAYPVTTATSRLAYVVNPGNNTTAILVNIFKYSLSPTFTNQPSVFATPSVSISLGATSDSTTTYALLSGTLPTGTTLNTSTGILSGTYPSQTAGVFTCTIQATDFELQSTTQTFVITVLVNDPLFPLTTLLLNAETTTTSFITDLSTVSNLLTVAGDVRADVFTPFRGDGYYGLYLPTNGDYYGYTDNNNFGTGDFTVEFWAYHTNNTLNMIIAATTNNWQFLTYLGTIYWQENGGNLAGMAGSVPLYQWVHLAASRTGGLLNIYINGIRTYSAANSYNYSATGTRLIGANSGGTNAAQYISNLRIIKGTGIYSGATITVPSGPLSAVAGTTLLTCQSAQMKDVSGTVSVFSPTGAPVVSQQNPFGSTSTVASNLGSVYFDGVSDYIATPLANSSLFDQTVPYTVEMWCYPASSGANQYLWSALSNPYNGIVYSGTGFYVDKAYVGTFIAQVGTYKPYQWYYVALTYDGTTTRLFVNGVLNGSAAGTGGSGASNPVYIGNYQNAPTSNGFIGYISNLRVTKGTALYTGTFATPVLPLTTSTGTVLLTCQYNGQANNYGIYDSSVYNWPLTRVGNATQGSFSPRSLTGWSLYVTGSTSYVNAPANSNFLFGTSDFSIEAWVYPLSVSTSPSVMASHQTGGEFYIVINSSNRLVFYINQNGSSTSYGTLTANSTTIPINTWTHIACTRVGPTCYVYVNGVRDATTLDMTGVTVGSYPNTNKPIYIGVGPDQGTPFTGYISNVRIEKGASAYTGTTFTVSTRPLTTTSNTVLLTCNTGTLKDFSTVSSALTMVNTPILQTFSPFSPRGAYSREIVGGSIYYDGAGDYITLPASSWMYNLLNDFTIEAWVYPTSLLANSWGLIDARVSGATAAAWAIGIDAASPGYKLNIFNGTSYKGGNITIPVNAWSHIVWTRTGTALSSYINGVRDYYNATFGTGAFSPGTTTPRLGTKDNGIAGYETPGYIADFRFVNGYGAYSGATIAVPTAPLTATYAGTTTQAHLLITGNTGPFIDAHGGVNVETFNNAQLSTTVTKFGTGSMYFNGAGAKMVIPDGPGIRFVTGDLTIECWFYVVGAQQSGSNIFSYYNGASAFGIVLHNNLASYPNKLTFWCDQYGTGPYITGTTTLTTSTWYHMALTRTAGVWKLFLNGTQEGSSYTNSATPDRNYALTIGGDYQSSSRSFTGYIDEFRITTGYSRFTATFTATNLTPALIQ